MKAFTSLLALGAIFSGVLAQTDENILYDDEHNKTVIVGTWASGSQQVVTGSGFANPSNTSFIYPNVTGVSYSFTNNEDGAWFEVARYRFKSNATHHNCITGIMLWNHGRYDLNPNGSITLHPAGDGYQQIQMPCAAVTDNFIEEYNETELMRNWRIFLDPTDGYKLHLFEWDGTPVAPLFQVSTEPQMLPLRKLRNSTAEAAKEKRDLGEGGNSAGVSGISVGLVAAGALSIAALVL